MMALRNGGRYEYELQLVLIIYSKVIIVSCTVRVIRTATSSSSSLYFLLCLWHPGLYIVPYILARLALFTSAVLLQHAETLSLVAL
ncbi:uncharacterized protein HD556DRAFT_1383179 [Suillus plorans]|uniref:Uncharacterized protein n=1 Tax=Suillus plorans TaxID=116603 RepID=A0A9P7ANF3_9AGAM|nr:uncharacterized protein HD556DRAFT_1383179 [Suillus plorans]KAG1791854.1 hypothetical protein HD556DRAFT_1383179 [Suillus plorans]